MKKHYLLAIFITLIALSSFLLGTLVKRGEIIATSIRPAEEQKNQSHPHDQYFVYIHDGKEILEIEVDKETWRSSNIGDQYITKVGQKTSKVKGKKLEWLLAPMIGIIPINKH